MVVQVGEVPASVSPPDEIGAFKNRAMMMKQLEDIGFKSIHIYEEGHSEFYSPWATMVAFKNIETRNSWYRNSAEVDIQIKKRIGKGATNAPLLRNFDGSTMMGYQVTPKVFDTIYCKQQTVPAECLDKNIKSNQAYNPILDRSSNSRQSKIHHFFGRGKSEELISSDAENETSSHPLHSKLLPEKFINGADLLIKENRLATCDASSLERE